MPTLPGGMEWVIILLIVLVLFGGAKLPGLARSMGQSITEFRKASKEDGADSEDPEASSERDADS